MAGAIILNPTHAKVGTSVLITGTGFTAADTITFTYGGSPITATEAPIIVNGDGTLPTCHIVIPASVQGVHAVVGTDGHAVTGSANFTVDSFISLSPTSGRIGSTTIVTATGLATASAITIDFAGTSVTPGGSPTSDATGGYTGTITIPTKASGARTVTLTDASANAPTATFTVSTPTLVLAPTTGPVGTVVTCTGTNYIPSATITFTNVDGSTTTATSDSSGNIPAATTVKIETSPNGSNNVTCGDGTNTATAAFTITQTITLDPTSGPATAEVEVSGLGFLASTTITVKIDGVTVTTVPSTITSDDDGAFVATTKLASLSSGAHTFLASDGTNSFSATFTVASTLPFTSITNSGTFARVYKWNENTEVIADDDSYADAVIMDTRNIANLLLTLADTDGSNGITYSTLGIIHETDNVVPPTDTAGIKKWSAIDTDVAVAAGTTGNKLYQNILWSYVLVRVKRTTSGQTAIGLFSAKTIDKNG